MANWRDEEPPDYAPTRAELEREEHEDLMRDTYESRLREFCRRHLLDPEDVQSVLIYEQEWIDSGGEERYSPDGGGPGPRPGG